MTEIKFYKYQGTGNDFVIIDNRALTIQRHQQALIENMCDRRLGIGADGVILLQEKDGYDFEMVYFNADGRESSMCGNGGRCIVAFAAFLGIITTTTKFWAIDGLHEATINGNWVELKMGDVETIENYPDHYWLNTGSPHYVTFVEKVAAIDVFETGRSIRYSDKYRAEGVNVNFVERTPNGIKVATYERGVEAETFSCGTGVTACALALYHKERQARQVEIETKGGHLKVYFNPIETGFNNIWLCGPAILVFQGVFPISG